MRLLAATALVAALATPVIAQQAAAEVREGVSHVRGLAATPATKSPPKPAS